MNKGHILLGFAIGLYSDELLKALRKLSVKLQAKAAVVEAETITAEKFQADFIAERKKMMGNDDN